MTASPSIARGRLDDLLYLPSSRVVLALATTVSSRIQQRRLYRRSVEDETFQLITDFDPKISIESVRICDKQGSAVLHATSLAPTATPRTIQGESITTGPWVSSAVWLYDGRENALRRLATAEELRHWYNNPASNFLVTTLVAATLTGFCCIAGVEEQMSESETKVHYELCEIDAQTKLVRVLGPQHPLAKNLPPYDPKWA